MGSNHWSHHISFFTHALTVKKKKKPVSLKNVLDEAVKIVDFLNSRPWITLPYTVQSEQTGGKHTEAQGRRRKQRLCECSGRKLNGRLFFMEERFCVKERSAEKPWHRLPKKMIKVRVSLQGKQLTGFVTNDTIQGFNWLFEF